MSVDTFKYLNLSTSPVFLPANLMNRDLSLGHLSPWVRKWEFLILIYDCNLHSPNYVWDQLITSRCNIHMLNICTQSNFKYSDYVWDQLITSSPEMPPTCLNISILISSYKYYFIFLFIYIIYNWNLMLRNIEKISYRDIPIAYNITHEH